MTRDRCRGPPSTGSTPTARAGARGRTAARSRSRSTSRPIAPRRGSGCRRSAVGGPSTASLRSARRTADPGSTTCSWASENGWLPADSRVRPRAAAASRTSAIVAARSRLASAAVWQMPVMTSIVLSNSSCLAFGMPPVGMAAAELLEDVRRGAHQRPGLRIDEGELHLDAQAGALGGVELDLHRARVQRYRRDVRPAMPFSARCTGALQLRGRPAVVPTDAVMGSSSRSREVQGEDDVRPATVARASRACRACAGRGGASRRPSRDRGRA